MGNARRDDDRIINLSGGENVTVEGEGFNITVSPEGNIFVGGNVSFIKTAKNR